MTVGRRVPWVLGVCLWSGPAQAECFNCGYGTAIAMAVAVALAVLGLVMLVVVKLGIGWTIKWAIGALVLAVAIPPLVIDGLHARKQRAFEELDHVGPLPRLADKTPLVILGGDLMSCPDSLTRLVRAGAAEGVLTLPLSTVETTDFAKPVPLADLPIARHTSAVETVDGGSAVDQEEAVFTEQRKFDRVTPLSTDDKAAAVAKIDYLIIAQCGDSHAFFDAFQGVPTLQDVTDHFDVELALAPIEKGSGMLSVGALTFDLLDLRYGGVTRGFLLSGARYGGENQVPYDPVSLEKAFCSTTDGMIRPDCTR